MKIIETIWFTGMYGFCGIVLAETEIEGERRAYLGVHGGRSEASDQRLIVEGGSRISPEIATRINNFLSGK